MGRGRLPEGIIARHKAACASRQGGGCNCSPNYQAQAWSPGDRKRLSRSFPTLAAAKGWRYDALVGLREGTIRAAGSVTLGHAADEWLSMAQAGLVLNRSGDVYKPSVLRSYEQSRRLRLVPALGQAKLADIRRSDLQRLVNRMIAEGHGPSTIRNSLMPLRAIYRYALALDEVAVNPTSGVQLPAVRGKRERIAPPAEAAALRRRPAQLFGATRPSFGSQLHRTWMRFDSRSTRSSVSACSSPDLRPAYMAVAHSARSRSGSASSSAAASAGGAIRSRLPRTAGS